MKWLACINEIIADKLLIVQILHNNKTNLFKCYKHYNIIMHSMFLFRIHDINFQIAKDFI